jgi:hypothetical protein
MQTTARSKTLLIPIVMAPLLMAGYLSCVQGDLPECPHDWDFSKIQVVNPKGELETLQTLNGSPLLSGPGAQTNVPEFNDCQRLFSAPATPLATIRCMPSGLGTVWMTPFTSWCAGSRAGISNGRDPQSWWRL